MDKRNKTIALIGISLLSFTGYLDATIVSTALPSIQNSLQMSVTELQWIMNAFFLGISAFMVSMGRVADLYGRRKIFYIGTLIFGLASLGAGYASTSMTLIICRAIQGITTAITIPVGIALIQNIFDQSEIAKAMGVFGSITGIGLAIGPVVGGILVSHFGWPAVFLVNIPFIILGGSMCLFTLNESRSQIEMSLDYGGILFLILSTGTLVFAVVEGGVFGWMSPVILTSAVIFLISLALLYWVEQRVAHPILSIALFKNTVFNNCILFNCVGGGLMAVILFISPLYLMLIIQKTVFATGLILFIMPLVVILISPLVGYANHKWHAKTVMTYGALFYCLVAVSQFLLGMTLNWWLLASSYIIFGIAWATVTQAPVVAIGQTVHEKDLSVAIGALFSFFNIGAAVLLALGTTLFHWFASHNIQQNLVKQNVILTEAQQKLVNLFINQPDKLSSVLNKLQMPQTNMSAMLQQAFMHGMHAMYLPLLILAFWAWLSMLRLDRGV